MDAIDRERALKRPAFNDPAIKALCNLSEQDKATEIGKILERRVRERGHGKDHTIYETPYAPEVLENYVLPRYTYFTWRRPRRWPGPVIKGREWTIAS